MMKTDGVRLITHFLKAYPRRSVLIVILLALSGSFELVSVFSLLPLLELANGEAATGSQAELMRGVESGLAWLGLEPTLGVLLGIIVLGMGLKGAFMWLALGHVGYATAHISADLRLMLIRAFIRARWRYFVSMPAGHLSNAITNEADRASFAYNAACQLLSAAIQVIVCMVAAFYALPSVAVAALLAAGLVILLMSGLVRMGRESGRRETQLIKSLSGRLIDALHSLKPIKAMAREEHLQPILEAETRELEDAQRRRALASGAMRAVHEPLLVLILAMGLFVILTTGAVAFSALLIMAFLFHRLVSRMNMAQLHYQSLVFCESAFWSLHDSVQLAETERESVADGRPPPPLEQGLEMRNVRFDYGAGDVLKDLSIEIPSGQFVSVIGPSGAGKTTLIDLLTGLYRPTEGEIFVDGIALSDIDLLAWRRMIGYVPQEALLFHASVLHNVTLGDDGIEPAHVEQALSAAGAWAFVTQLPAGIDTVIGERGSKLSGGQRQRIAIARALVRQPRLLVLDEVTTALDPETEAAICRTLEDLSGSRTIVSISHQPALERVADVVYRLHDGRLVPEASMKPAQSLSTVTTPGSSGDSARVAATSSSASESRRSSTRSAIAHTV